MQYMYSQIHIDAYIARYEMQAHGHAQQQQTHTYKFLLYADQTLIHMHAQSAD